MSCALSIRFTPAAAATVRVLMYRPRKALKITSAQQSAPAPTFFKLVLFSVTTNMPFPPTRFVLKRIYGAGRGIITALRQIHFPAQESFEKVVSSAKKSLEKVAILAKKSLEKVIYIFYNRCSIIYFRESETVC